MLIICFGFAVDTWLQSVDRLTHEAKSNSEVMEILVENMHWKREIKAKKTKINISNACNTQLYIHNFSKTCESIKMKLLSWTLALGAIWWQINVEELASTRGKQILLKVILKQYNKIYDLSSLGWKTWALLRLMGKRYPSILLTYLCFIVSCKEKLPFDYFELSSY